MACDEIVASRIADPGRYAEVLLRFAAGRPSLTAASLATAPMASAHGLKARVCAIMRVAGGERGAAARLSRADLVLCVTMLGGALVMADVFFRPGL